MSYGVFNDALLSEIRSQFRHVDRIQPPADAFIPTCVADRLAFEPPFDKAAEVAERPDNAGRDNAASRDRMRSCRPAEPTHAFRGGPEGTDH